MWDWMPTERHEQVYRELKAAAAHLTPGRMARVSGQVWQGLKRGKVDLTSNPFKGMPKRDQLRKLTEVIAADPYNPGNLERARAMFRCELNKHGERALDADCVPFLLQTLRAAHKTYVVTASPYYAAKEQAIREMLAELGVHPTKADEGEDL